MTPNQEPNGPLRLHVGGTEPKAGWKIFNVQRGPQVDFEGSIVDLGAFSDGSVEEVYASHVLEHLGYQTELLGALKEVHRVLRPGGRFYLSVPDLEVLCQLFLVPNLDINSRFHIMRIMFGGQTDDYDFHYVGLTEAFIADYLQRAGFTELQRVSEFGLFNDSSSLRILGQLISLNLTAV